MFAPFLLALRGAGLPVSVTEYLALMGAMREGVAAYSVEDFYFLSRAILVKDERHLDRFDRVFAEAFKGLEAAEGLNPRALPEDAAAGRTAGRTEGAPPGRQQVDRHRRHLPVRRLWLQSRRRADRPGQVAPQARGEGLG
jgi:uncharacterized protein with von Willebrand factor type A (vWA) domain